MSKVLTARCPRLHTLSRLVCQLVGGVLLSTPLLPGWAVAARPQSPRTELAKKSEQVSSAPLQERKRGQDFEQDESRQRVRVAEFQGLSVKVTVSQPLSWFSFEKENLALREPQPDDLFGVQVSLEDSKTHQCFAGADVKCLVKDPKSNQTLTTTTTLVPVWDPKGCFFAGNFALPSNGPSIREISLVLHIIPVDRFARSLNVATTFAVAPVVAEVGPFQLDEKALSGAKFTEKKISPHLDTGRHPPIEPTPYPGAKSHN